MKVIRNDQPEPSGVTVYRGLFRADYVDTDVTTEGGDHYTIHYNGWAGPAVEGWSE